MQSPNRFYYTWRLLFLHHSFAWCFFFYLSFLFPPVEPGVFNCCETRKKHAIQKIACFFYMFRMPHKAAPFVLCLCKELIESFSALCENVGIHAYLVILFGVGITVTVNPDACKLFTDMIRQFRVILLEYGRYPLALAFSIERVAHSFASSTSVVANILLTIPASG